MAKDRRERKQNHNKGLGDSLVKDEQAAAASAAAQNAKDRRERQGPRTRAVSRMPRLDTNEAFFIHRER